MGKSQNARYAGAPAPATAARNGQFLSNADPGSYSAVASAHNADYDTRERSWPSAFHLKRATSWGTSFNAGPGYWRFVYDGNSISGPATAVGDNVRVG